ncbi:P-loop containing nucleoside triphosphate hydrolase protein [Coniella lustricola]|uniref:P-loop containing nucleoside triphosphate hydrolase protein n=1 Tax=Coniella lustricola TaxID=2025994 RepID=A0A2T3A6X6_9PEZI|nr:P-loop containing nucleoside triphosphate hydrolase protein [Coniella lustricola]
MQQLVTFAAGLLRRLGGSTATDRRLSQLCFVPSSEQQHVVNLSRTQNVVVSARPGTGKTATAEAIVDANADQKIAVVTYSKRLQLETAKRLGSYAQADVFTFHGLACKLFSTQVSTDTILRDLRKSATAPSWTPPAYNIIALDELQDCTDDLFWLVCVFMSSIAHAAGGNAPRIVTLGDERQAIYGFRGADSRYLSLSPELLSPLSPYPWARAALSKSFRLSHQTSRFVNEAYLGGEEYLVGSHDGPKPLYVPANPFDHDAIAKYLIPFINEYGPERTAILTPFVRNNPSLSNLTNLLSRKYGIQIAVSISDEVVLDDLVLSGKLAVSSYHQFKGNERDLVIVYGADDGYFQFLGRDLPDDRCPNDIFVALTRARKQLIVMHDDKQAFMPFVTRRALSRTAHFVPLTSRKINERPPERRPAGPGLLLPRNVAISDMSRHVLDESLDTICKEYLETITLASPCPERSQIKAPDKVLTDPGRMRYEPVSDINGIAVVAAYEYDLQGTLATLGSKKGGEQPMVSTGDEAKAAWLCRQACEYEASISGYQSRYIQMAHHKFDWLTQQLEAAKQRLREQFRDHDKLNFEYLLGQRDFVVRDSVGVDGKEQRTKLKGRADIIQHIKPLRTLNDTPKSISPLRRATLSAPAAEETSAKPPQISEDVCLWEIKFVSQLSLEHMVQASTYAYLWAFKHKTDTLPRILLFNLCSGEKIEIKAKNGRAGLECLVEDVLKAKYSFVAEVSTNQFLKACAKTRDEVQAIWAYHSGSIVAQAEHAQ